VVGYAISSASTVVDILNGVHSLNRSFAIGFEVAFRC
jgi:hypothetical protein